MEQAGLRVNRAEEVHFETTFHDVAALVWYLRIVPWAAPGFSVERHRSRLEEIHSRIQREGPIRIPDYGFWLEAEK
jgi:hypothetical protein